MVVKQPPIDENREKRSPQGVLLAVWSTLTPGTLPV